MPVSVFARHTVAVLRYAAELQDRAALHAQSATQFLLDRESSYKRLPHWISLLLLPLKSMLNDYSRCVVIRQKESGTELGCPCIGGYF